MLVPLLLLSGSGSYATATSPAPKKEQTEPKKLENKRGYLQLKFKDCSGAAIIFLLQSFSCQEDQKN